MAKAKKPDTSQTTMSFVTTGTTSVVASDSKSVPDSASAPFIGPHLAVALIAEAVLTETNNKMSIIRVVDKIGLASETITTINKDEVVTFPLVVVISFKAGGFKGESAMLLVQVGPAGESEPIGLSRFQFAGGNDTWEIKMTPLNMKWYGPGQYWFDVYLDNKLFSRIPFQIEEAPKPSQEKQGP
jgi:hypothetical protein